MNLGARVPQLLIPLLILGCGSKESPEDDSSPVISSPSNEPSAPTGPGTSVAPTSPSAVNPAEPSGNPTSDGSTPPSGSPPDNPPSTGTVTPNLPQGGEGAGGNPPAPTDSVPSSTDAPAGGGGAPPAAPTGATPNGGAGGGAGAGGSTGIDGPTTPSLPSFMLGADISSVQEAVDRGARYVDTDGQEKPMLELLENHGFNTIRLRTFVDPSAEYGYAAGTGNCEAKAEPYADKAHTIEFAREIEAAGLSLLLDLHYSDTWADPGKQIIPSAWRGAANISELASLVHAYTVDVVSSLADAGAKPGMVQVGNEITPGMLIHVPGADTDCWGNNSVPHRFGGSTSNWDDLAELLKAGIAGVRAVDPEIKVMLHLESTDDLPATRWWVQSALSRGVEFDVLGLSCYTQWQGSPAVWRNTFTTLANEFPQLSFVIAEYNPERTAANQVMLDLPDGRGLGTFFWEPTQSGEWGQSMFTSSGNTLQARSEDFQEYDQLRSVLGL